MDILSYLLALLQQRKEVGVTGLGTFYKKKYPGRYDKEKQTFLPPGYTLQFSTEVTEEEALVNFISTKNNITNEDARHHITQFVEEVNQKLELDHEAELQNTGRLFFTEQGLDFEPVKNMNYGSEFYGLPPLAETVIEETKTALPQDEEEVYDEIAEAPSASSPFENKSYQAPVIENVELDEVRDDFKNTLKHTETDAAEITEAPEFIKEQHEEHPNHFGHTPESEVENVISEQHTIESEPTKKQEEVNPAQEVEIPESVITQHEEHPNRFGHAPESEVENIAAEHQAVEDSHTNKTEQVEDKDKAPASPVDDVNQVEVPRSIVEQHQENPDHSGYTPAAETEKIAEEPAEIIIPEPVLPQQEYSSRFSLRSETDEPKTYISLEDEAKKEEPVIEAPAFIKEQHAGHPNRFGHDPIQHSDEPTQGMSTWLMITIALVALLVIAAITFLIKPELFTGETTNVVKPAQLVVDSPKVAVDTLKAKQDSIAKTDSILKANQVQKKADTVKKDAVKPAFKPAVEATKENKVVPNTGPSTFYVIAASFQSEKKALVFIKQMEKIGLKAEIASVPGRLKKVSIASFSTEKEAKEQKDILEKKLKGKGYFVQQKHNTQP
ncbi:SPOR domain-containing protein [Pedobacter sp. KACC 23697]|uniref:SPOR domain-containing protein n=1 Tax=Pedobacter sp. KACC 23697 TaxID=3149230 RepID=A0AAU7JZY6_9SPHI